MTQSSPTHAVSSEMTTLVHDPLHDEILLKLPGAVVLPPGTVVELSGGQIARVTSLRLIAVDDAQAQLVVQVVRPHPVAQGGL